MFDIKELFVAILIVLFLYIIISAKESRKYRKITSEKFENITQDTINLSNLNITGSLTVGGKIVGGSVETNGLIRGGTVNINPSTNAGQIVTSNGQLTQLTANIVAGDTLSFKKMILTTPKGNMTIGDIGDANGPGIKSDTNSLQLYGGGGTGYVDIHNGLHVYGTQQNIFDGPTKLGGKITATGGGDFMAPSGSGGRWYFGDTEGGGTLRVGCYNGSPGLFSDTNIEIGSANGWSNMRDTIRAYKDVSLSSTSMVIDGKRTRWSKPAGWCDWLIGTQVC